MPWTAIRNKKPMARTPTNIESVDRRADHVEMATAPYASAEFKMPHDSKIPLAQSKTLVIPPRGLVTLAHNKTPEILSAQSKTPAMPSVEGEIPAHVDIPSVQSTTPLMPSCRTIILAHSEKSKMPPAYIRMLSGKLVAATSTECCVGYGLARSPPAATSR